jgi:beta-1,4-mannosyl-glycoprotein beta-1,4-N-acetylglucosaminyltransferase|tara:strand:- start:1362 stop:2174 length:813 start_codon:yes stop_codon:yes gene_type:complete
MMLKNKIYDCVTFFDENLIVNSRFEILKDVVDYFVVVESNYDHKGNKKRINFKLQNKKFKDRVRHIVIEKNFPNLENVWDIESFQRERIYEGINDSSENDYIMYSDSDEIPNPKTIKNMNLNKKYGIFLQSFFVYKINIFNEHETPWEGTRICKKKHLKNFTHLRKKIRCKNITKSFFNFKYEKSIKIIENGGWHFNNLYNAETISKKLKTFQHTEFSDEKYSSIEKIKKRIINLEDLFGRNHRYNKVEINEDFPKYIRDNLEMFKDYIV